MDERDKQEIIDEIKGIVRPFPANPKEGDKFRRYRPSALQIGQSGEMVIYIFDGFKWISENK